ncbi:serine hydrolase domain-containing protein [Leucobacter massiliensis]|uniref:Beta-lactamase n=1 Tax=Leucobacter massiliensis TaxID=1686285 RepID=A0A2S9QKC8_9MICO|nr:serine hydrolase domain-containing protein [Leucobacter massiliensis]PRI10035.1 hypothetical protein B4915_14020 [Leucobacter massiliensis]PRI10052.1 hypothetical protein B4915_14135 [Leucobacter massiliensis]
MGRPRPFGAVSAEVSALAGRARAPLAVSLRSGERGWCRTARPGVAAGDRFEIGSVSKVLTGTLLGVLAEAGEVDPDAPVDEVTGERLPWRDRAPSLAELATHHSGLPNTPPRLGPREAVGALGLSRRDPWRGVSPAAYRVDLSRAAARARADGGFRYSSMGIGLLGDALAAASGRPFAELIRERLLLPLGMTRTGLDRPEGGADAVSRPHNRRGMPMPYLRDHMPGAGMFASSLADLERLLDAVRDPGATPLAAGIRSATAVQRAAGPGLGVGYCWLIREATAPGGSGPAPTGEPVLLHDGATWGSQAHVSVGLATGRAVAAMSAIYRDLDGFATRFLGEGAAGR